MRRSPQPIALFLLATLLVGGCGSAAPATTTTSRDSLSPGEVAPATDAERELLTKLETLPAETVTVAGQTFVLGVIYSAASGRLCRSVGSEAGERLACDGGTGWVFVPSVFGTP